MTLWILCMVIMFAPGAAKPLKFMHITKTAGTAIEKLGFDQQLFWGRHHTNADARYGFWHELPQRKNQTYLALFDWFTVVRNPYDRLYSIYSLQELTIFRNF